MANVVEFGGGRKDAGLTGEQLMLREQLAAQIVAVMRAHFTRPEPQEMKQILRCAEGQITALALSPSGCP